MPQLLIIMQGAGEMASHTALLLFRVVESFNRYSGGIYPASSCSALDINHAMVRGGRASLVVR